jgi:hypothetical protein
LTAYYVSSYVTFYLNYLFSATMFVIVGFLLRLQLFVKTEIFVLIIALFLWGHIQVSLAFFFSAIFKSSRSALVFVFLAVVCGVITSYIVDQIFTKPEFYPYWLFLWPPIAFYRLLGMLNKHAASARLPVLF